MMSMNEVSPEQFARAFHHYHEALAPDFNCGTAVPPDSWQDLPLNERSRLIAAARLALLEIAAARSETRNDRDRYFAKPGEAEWGC